MDRIKLLREMIERAQSMGHGMVSGCFGRSLIHGIHCREGLCWMVQWAEIYSMGPNLPEEKQQVIYNRYHAEIEALIGDFNRAFAQMDKYLEVAGVPWVYENLKIPN